MKTKTLLLFAAFAFYPLISLAQFSGAGAGTVDDPYRITTVDELFDIKSDVSAYYLLMNDIDMTEWLEAESPKQGWIPINTFTGSFDGNGHSISGLFINRPTTDYVGLFSMITGKVKNLKLINSNVTGQSEVGVLAGRIKESTANPIDNITIIDAKVSASTYAGGVAGYLYKIGQMSIENLSVTGTTVNCSGLYSGGCFGYAYCGSSGSINNVKVKNVSVSGTENVGGLAGSIYFEIHDCSVVQAVISGSKNVGGLSGTHAYQGVENNVVIGCDITGTDHIGGLLGNENLGRVENNVVIGCDITGTNYIGGLLGYFSTSTSSSIKKCYVEGQLTCNSVSGGYVGGLTSYEKGPSSIRSIEDNKCDVDIIGNNAEYVAGIVAYSNYPSSLVMRRNIATGNLYGLKKVYGIGNCSSSYNFNCSEVLSSINETPLRIGATSTTDGAYNGTIVLKNNKEVDVQDGNGNGTSYSLRMLKRTSTYSGSTFDFDNTWSIIEGSTLPYLANMSEPVTITSCESGTVGRITGTAATDGVVYVRVGDKLIEGVVFGGTWEVLIDNLADNTIVKVYTESTGMLPSIPTVSTAVAPSTQLVVLDETSTTVPEAATGVNVHVVRTIKADEWSTICLPFGMSEAQCKEAFGDDVELADFTGCDVDDTTGDIRVNFSDVTAIEANHPYIIKVSAPVTEFVADGVDITPEEEPYIDRDEETTGSGRNKKTTYNSFIGTYVAETVVPDYALFLSDNQFWFSTGNTKMKAFRAYFDLATAGAEYEDEEVAARVFIAFDEGMTTGVEGLTPALSEGEGVYYNLNGLRVTTPSKGLYIKNHKKVVVR